tara:strand:- start:218 stop:649 length:432 start_codon:yes stop_codon:yes gene_type:complete
MYKRRYREGNTWRETVVLDPLFRECLEHKKDASHVVGAYDIAPEEHMAVQATIQKYIDNAISKTINLPKDADANEISDIALRFAPYMKGMTVYRAGSKGDEPLVAIPNTPENIREYAYPMLQEKAEDETVAAACRIGDNSCGD